MGLESYILVWYEGVHLYGACEIMVVTWKKCPEGTVPNRAVCGSQGIRAARVVWMHPQVRRADPCLGSLQAFGNPSVYPKKEPLCGHLPVGSSLAPRGGTFTLLSNPVPTCLTLQAQVAGWEGGGRVWQMLPLHRAWLDGHIRGQ